jgi:lipopolysaccharide export system permease protein
VIFSIYWMGLIGGEKLAEPGYVPPWVAMWGTNVIFLVLGSFMYARMGRETSTTRGGALDELWWRIGRVFRSRRARAGEGAA